MHAIGTLERTVVLPRIAPRFAAVAVLTVAVLTAVAQLVASFSPEYWLDEAYMLGLARHPITWGYVDQPPLVPLLAAAMDHIAPGSMIALRIPAILATAAAVVVAGLITREIGGDRRAQFLTALAQSGALWITLTGHWLTPYTMEPLQWGLVAWVLVRWIRIRDDRLLVLLGVIVGIGTETKAQMFLLCAVLIGTLLVFGPRDLLRRRMLLGGAGIAALCALPALVWQAMHGWPQLRMGPVAAQETAQLTGGRLGTAGALLIAAGVVGTWLTLYGLWLLLRERSLRRYRFLGATFVIMYAFIVITAGRPYYLDGLYPVCAAFGALGLQRRRAAGRTRWRWAVWPATVLTAATSAYLLLVSWNISNPYMAAGPRYAAQVARAYTGLVPGERAHTAILGGDYLIASYLDVYGPRFGLPPVASPNRGYGYLRPPSDDQDTVLYVGPDPVRLHGFFDSVRRVGSVDEISSVWLCTGRHGSWAQWWPRLRSLVIIS